MAWEGFLPKESREPRFEDQNVGATAHRISFRLNAASIVLGLLVLCAVAPAALFTGKQGAEFSAASNARVSLAGLDLSTPDGAREADERIRKAAHALCARNLGKRPLDWCVDDVLAAGQRQIRERTIRVSLAGLDLSTPQGVHVARGRLEAAARRVCQDPHLGSEVASTRNSDCVDETFARALRRVELLERISVDF